MDGLLIGGSPASLQADDVNALIGISGNVQTQLDNKLSLSGGTMDAGLSPPANITFQGGEVLGLPAVPSAADAAASKQYVDDQITSGTGELTAIAWIPSTVSPPPTIDVNENTAVFTVTSPSTSYNLYLEGVSRDGHTHAAIDVVLDNSFNTAYPTNLQASTEYVEGELESIKQQIGTGQPVEVTLNIERKFELLSSTIVAGSPYQVLPHTVDDNNLSITINGIKQYNHSRASQNIVFKSGILSSFVTGLDDTLDYDFNINVDGAGATLITITAGTTVTTFDDLITAINNAMNVGSPPLLNNVVASVTIDGVITFITDSSGSGSTISITDPSTANDYLFDIDASPDAINSAVFVSDTSQVIGSPPGSPATLPTPDTIEILGDVSATFTVGRAFAIFGSSDPTYGTFDGTYSVHVNGPVVGGSPLTTSIPIAQLGAPNTNVPLLGAYNPAGSPTPPAPSPSAYGDVYITPLVNIDYVDTAVSGLSGDYTETDAAGNDVRAGELTSYVVFNYDILSGSRIETLKYS